MVRLNIDAVFNQQITVDFFGLVARKPPDHRRFKTPEN